MSETTTLIEESMLISIKEHFKLEDLKETAINFVTFKKQYGFPFGELTILHYQMFGGNSEDIYKAAAAVELAILSLDIFDDLQDQDNHSMPWQQISNPIAMNIATGFLILSIKTLQQTSFALSSKLKAIHCLTNQVLKAVNGQHQDLVNAIDIEEDYLQMIGQKSGSLIAAACLVGTALATDFFHDIVQEYAEKIGISVQIRNDMKDLFLWDEKSDLINKKKTLPILYLLQKEEPRLQILKDYFSEMIEKENLLKKKTEIQTIIEESGVIEYTSVIMRVYQLEAKEKIESLNIEKEWKDQLLARL